MVLLRGVLVELAILCLLATPRHTSPHLVTRRHTISQEKARLEKAEREQREKAARREKKRRSQVPSDSEDSGEDFAPNQPSKSSNSNSTNSNSANSNSNINSSGSRNNGAPTPADGQVGTPGVGPGSGSPRVAMPMRTGPKPKTTLMLRFSVQEKLGFKLSRAGIVTNVDSGTQGERLGVREGMRVFFAAGSQVNNRAEIQDLIRKFRMENKANLTKPLQIG